MSNIRVRRLVDNITGKTNIYGAIVEAVVNGIDAVEEAGVFPGEIVIRVKRDRQRTLDGILPAVTGLCVEDNGIGFTDAHCRSFDTLYTEQKAKKGGKGFGRFICLKHFDEFSVESVYKQDGAFWRRSFRIGRENDIITDETRKETEAEATGTKVFLEGAKGEQLRDKKLQTIASSLVEILLPYFIDEKYQCPRIILTEEDGSERIVLNDFSGNELASKIVEMELEKNSFTCSSFQGEQVFTMRLFKIYSPRGRKSRIVLVAGQRKVTQCNLEKYIPEFSEEFYEKPAEGEDGDGKNYVVMAYVFGNYLDDQVSHERGDFKFAEKNDGILGISQENIEREAATLAKTGIGDEFTVRSDKKKERVVRYVDESPWYKPLVKDIDLSDLPCNPDNEQIEEFLHRAQFQHEVKTRKKVAEILLYSSLEQIRDDVQRIVKQVTELSKSALVHYVAQRKAILKLFEKSMSKDEQGKYSPESTLHDIIFPRKKDSDTISYEEHNLWLLDERLNFTSRIVSEAEIAGSKDRIDLLAVYDRLMLFRGENEPGNPVTLFEFKRPMRDDFANPSSKEDPVEQIIRYVRQLRNGPMLTCDGRPIRIEEHTPFYGYVVCDFTRKVEDWLYGKDFKPGPDKLGYYCWHGNYRLSIEVLSWEKVLKDARMRNGIFFHKLGLPT